MTDINFSNGTDTPPNEGQQYVLTKEGLQGLAAATITKITGPEAIAGGKSITIYHGNGDLSTIGVGSNINFSNAVVIPVEDQSSIQKPDFEVTIDGTSYSVPIDGFGNGTTAQFFRGDKTWNNILISNGRTELSLFNRRVQKGQDIAENYEGTNITYPIADNINVPYAPVGGLYFKGTNDTGQAVRKNCLGHVFLDIQHDGSSDTGKTDTSHYYLTRLHLTAIENVLERDNNNDIIGSENNTTLFITYDKRDLAGDSNIPNGSFEKYNRRIYTTNDTAFKATKVFNAVFNDYAEYRTTIDLEPGRVVIDQDNGSLACASTRLQPGAQVISDTFGHSMGETDTAKTPIAVAGRVLVYPYKARENYHAGMAVCSAPDGTVDIMTREEIRDYPDCIVGIVSEIPEYETWGSDNIKVNGRIWIRVK